MFEILTLSVVGSIYVLLPMWRSFSFKKISQVSSSVSPVRLNEVVVTQTVGEPNCHVTYEVQLPPDEHTFIQNFVDNVLNRIASGQLPQWETLGEVPQGLINTMKEYVGDSNRTFFDLITRNQVDILIRHLLDTCAVNSLNGRPSLKSKIQETTVNNTQGLNAAGSNGSPDGGDILVFLFSLFFTSYIIFRIASLKEKQNNKTVK